MEVHLYRIIDLYRTFNRILNLNLAQSSTLEIRKSREDNEMAAQMKLLSSFAIATNDASWPTVAPTTMYPTMGPSVEPECEWIRNNENTDGEQYAGEVSSMEECVELVQTICEWANIANVHEDVFHGEAGMYGAQTDCWCQQGDDKTVDEWEEYMNCWFEPSGEGTYSLSFIHLSLR